MTAKNHVKTVQDTEVDTIIALDEQVCAKSRRVSKTQTRDTTGAKSLCELHPNDPGKCLNLPDTRSFGRDPDRTQFVIGKEFHAADNARFRSAKRCCRPSRKACRAPD